MRLWILLLALACCTQAGAESPASPWDGLTPVAVGATIEFQGAPGREKVRPLALAPLQDPLFISWLRPATDAVPYLLISAISPDVAERSLYLVRANGSTPPQRVIFPGRVLDPKTREVVHESHAFYGRCLDSQENEALVLYQRDRNDRKRRLQTSVYVAEATPGMLHERLIERRLPTLSSLQARSRRKECKEIPGKNRLFDAAFFQLRNQRADLPEDDEDKNDEKDDENEERKDSDGKKAAAENLPHRAPGSVGMERLERRAISLI